MNRHEMHEIDLISEDVPKLNEFCLVSMAHLVSCTSHGYGGILSSSRLDTILS